MNELAKICHLLGIRTRDVLEYPQPEWNFLKFHPGLVAGDVSAKPEAVCREYGCGADQLLRRV